MTQTSTYISIMQESLARKKGYLQEILELTIKQGNLAKKPELDREEMDRIIDRKEILINNINEIDRGFMSVYERIKPELEQDSSSCKSELVNIQAYIKECVDLGVEIQTTEERNRASMEAAFASGFTGVKQAKTSIKVASKYYKSMSGGMVNDSFMYDKKK